MPAGQAQKEFYVNEAHSLTDMLLHPAIEGEADTPPGSPQDGECWLVGSSPVLDWQGHPGEVACFQAGVWLFAIPREGMRVLDRTAGQDIRFRDGVWQRAIAPAALAGGTTIDSEARAAIAELISALVDGGILPDN